MSTALHSVGLLDLLHSASRSPTESVLPIHAPTPRAAFAPLCLIAATRTSRSHEIAVAVTSNSTILSLLARDFTRLTAHFLPWLDQPVAKPLVVAL